MALIDAVFADRPGMTPQDVERQRRLAKALLEENSGTEPLQHPLQAVAKILGSGVGAWKDSKASKAEAAGMDKRRKMMGSLLTGGAAPMPATGAAPAPLPATAAGAQIGATAPGGDMVASTQPMRMRDAGDIVQGVMDAGGANNGWLKYANQGATRSQPISDKLSGALGFLPELGVSMEVFSGGQPGQGEGGTRTGSTRHDHGNAADVFFYKDGRKLDWNNPEDQPIFSEIVKRGKAAGITGFGAGDGYMQPGSMHIGFGTPAVWGAGGKGDNAAGWLRSAYNSAASAPGQIASASPAAAAIASQVPQLPPPVNVSTPAVPPQNAQLAQALIGGQSPQPAPGLSPQVIQQLLGDPWTADMGEKLVGTYLESQMQQQQAQREAAMKQAERQAQWAREDQRNAVLDGRADRDYGFQREKFGVEQQSAAMTGDIREYEFAKQQGYAGSFTDYQRDMKKAGAQNINMGTIPPGYQLVTDPQSGAQRMEPIPGSPVSTANEKSAEGRETVTSVVTTAAQRAREAMAGATLPTDGTVGGFLSRMPGTAAAEVRRQVDVLKSNAKIENLSAMRRESPTGGALGAVSDSENAMLAAKAGALDPDSPNFARDLDDYERSLLRTIHGKEAGDQIYAQTRAAAPQGDNQGGPPDGVDPSIWEAMTPEERALWQN